MRMTHETDGLEALGNLGMCRESCRFLNDRIHFKYDMILLGCYIVKQRVQVSRYYSSFLITL